MPSEIGSVTQSLNTNPISSAAFRSLVATAAQAGMADLSPANSTTLTDSSSSISSLNGTTPPLRQDVISSAIIQPLAETMSEKPHPTTTGESGNISNGLFPKKGKGKRKTKPFDDELEEDELELDEMEESEEDEEPEPGEQASDEGSDSQQVGGERPKALTKMSLLNRMCRLCGQETQTNRKVHFFTHTGVSNDYKNRLVSAMRFLNNDPKFDILQMDSLPHFFCRKCHTRLLSFERSAQNLRVVFAKGLKVFQTVENGTHPSQIGGARKAENHGGAENNHSASKPPAAVKTDPSSFEILARASQAFQQPAPLSSQPQPQPAANFAVPARPPANVPSFPAYSQLLPYAGFLPHPQQQQFQQQQLQHLQQQQLQQQQQQQQQQQPKQPSPPQVSLGTQGKRSVSQVDTPTADSDNKLQATGQYPAGNLESIGNLLGMQNQPMYGVQQYGYSFPISTDGYQGMLAVHSPFSPLPFSQGYGFLPQAYFPSTEPQAQVRNLAAQQQQQSLPQLPVPMRPPASDDTQTPQAGSAPTKKS